MTPAITPAPVQGEGDYEAARRYDKAQHDFVEAGKVDDAARKAAPRSPEEEAQLREAERKGRSHAKGEAPTIQPPVPTLPVAEVVSDKGSSASR